MIPDHITMINGDKNLNLLTNTMFIQWSNLPAMLTLPVGVLDEEGYARYAICQDCFVHVHCRPVGIANIEKQHRGYKICKEVEARCGSNKNTKIKKKQIFTGKQANPKSYPFYSHQQLHNLLICFSTFSDLWKVKKWKSKKARKFTNKIMVNVSNLL